MHYIIIFLIYSNRAPLDAQSKRPLLDKRSVIPNMTKPSSTAAANAQFKAPAAVQPPVQTVRPTQQDVESTENEEDITMRDTTADLVTAKKAALTSKTKTPLSSKMADVETFSDEEIEEDDLLQEEEPHQAKRRRLELDEFHLRDAQYVGDYVDEIFDHLRAVEPLKKVNPNYMTRQTDITARMREILIDWLIEVHAKFQLAHETLYLTVSIIDRFLERRAVSRNKLQLVGCTAMLLASKYEEM